MVVVTAVIDGQNRRSPSQKSFGTEPLYEMETEKFLKTISAFYSHAVHGDDLDLFGRREMVGFS
ncbi:hypothetical protein COCNU_03G004390 [Cocos nucifera]|uniref:Uncharacterized protein n=1 Tax=Cocos nucifera TaxID=13894 RepID=A0A8K0I1V7_COCNU|nr:hypothetical protein COCNU_03G004390 [Cocos nucifera]